MKENEMLCPFKKTTTEEYSGSTGRTVTYERFEVCAGDRCMAYRPPTKLKHTPISEDKVLLTPERPECLRLTNHT